MRFEVKRPLFLGILVLNTLFVAWSLFFTGEKVEKVVYAGEGEELFGLVTIKQRKGQSFHLRKVLMGKQPRQPQEPPPAPAGPKGPIP
ncbi:hypothetical protein ACB092_04G209500 [Castanea dentata]